MSNADLIARLRSGKALRYPDLEQFADALERAEQRIADTERALKRSQGVEADVANLLIRCERAEQFSEAANVRLHAYEQSLQRAEQDARRYRWLRERYSAADMQYKDYGEGQCGRPVAIFSVNDPWPFSFDYELAAELLDAAIDAELAKESAAGKMT